MATAAVLVSVFLLVLLAAMVGFVVAHMLLDSQRRNLEYEQTALDTERQALDNTRRVREIFLSARRAMQAEAQRAAQTGQCGHGYRDQGEQR